MGVLGYISTKQNDFESSPVIIIVPNEYFTESTRDINSLTKKGIILDRKILSASSLSFCGAYISYLENYSKINGVYLAPKYWIGHRKKEWYPKTFKNDWITYM